jgi:hypothetical protein
LPHAASKATEAATPEATETATAASTRSMAGTPYGYASGNVRVPEGKPMLDVRRREFITLLGGAAVAWPFAASAQQPGKLPTIAVLGSASAPAWAPLTAAFAQRLRDLGWIDGRSVAIEYRWAEGRGERAADIAAEFVRLKVDVSRAFGSSG